MKSEKGHACVVLFAIVCFIIILAVVFGLALGIANIYMDAGIFCVFGICAP